MEKTTSNGLETLFATPGIIGICADVNQGKSMLLYHMIQSLRTSGNFTLYTYGLRSPLKDSTIIYTVKELEEITDSVIVLDEVAGLFNLNDGKARRSIENTLRLIHHNNNVLLLCGVPENFKKFLSAKLNIIIYKQSTIADFINGSCIKHRLTEYCGPERGTAKLKLPKDKALVYNGNHYTIIEVPYYKEYDTKKTNPSIISFS